MKTCVFILLALVANGVQAMPWHELQVEIASIQRQQPPNPTQLARLVSTVDMTVIYSKALKAQGREPLFCLATGSAMQFNDVIDILVDQAKHQQASGDTPVGELLLRGLQRRFPCGEQR